jgi:hypothetical protein
VLRNSDTNPQGAQIVTKLTQYVDVGTRPRQQGRSRSITLHRAGSAETVAAMIRASVDLATRSKVSLPALTRWIEDHPKIEKPAKLPVPIDVVDQNSGGES